MFFKKNLPPKTTLNNFLDYHHLEEVLLWFLKNDTEVRIIESKMVKKLFNEGIRPECEKYDNPDTLVKVQNNPAIKAKPIERYLALKISLDLRFISGMVKKEKLELDKFFESVIDSIEKKSEKTLISSGTIAQKYNLDNRYKAEPEKELAKIKNEKEKEEFKYNYLADAIISSEVRILAWIYRELFNKDYKIKKDKGRILSTKFNLKNEPRNLE